MTVSLLYKENAKIEKENPLKNLVTLQTLLQK